MKTSSMYRSQKKNKWNQSCKMTHNLTKSVMKIHEMLFYEYLFLTVNKHILEMIWGTKNI
jgi:hypothetical protein